MKRARTARKHPCAQGDLSPLLPADETLTLVGLAAPLLQRQEVDEESPEAVSGHLCVFLPFIAIRPFSILAKPGVTVWEAAHKHEDVSSDPQHPRGKPGMAVHTYTSSTGGMMGGQQGGGTAILTPK